MFGIKSKTIELSTETTNLIKKLIYVFKHDMEEQAEKFVLQCHATNSREDPESSLKKLKIQAANMLETIKIITNSMTDEQKNKFGAQEFNKMSIKLTSLIRDINWNPSIAANSRIILAEKMLNVLTSVLKELQTLDTKISN
jgi:hypothetical protein